MGGSVGWDEGRNLLSHSRHMGTRWEQLTRASMAEVRQDMGFVGTGRSSMGHWKRVPTRAWLRFYFDLYETCTEVGI